MPTSQPKFIKPPLAEFVPSHFLVFNLQGQIDIMELPGGDATHARMYVGPRIYGAGADLVPVTLRFVTSAHLHHPDMLILFQNTQVVYHNSGGVFQPATHTRRTRKCVGAGR